MFMHFFLHLLSSNYSLFQFFRHSLSYLLFSFDFFFWYLNNRIEINLDSFNKFQILFYLFVSLNDSVTIDYIILHFVFF
jgi:hypothetical protein